MSSRNQALVESDIREITALINSRGWAILREAMDRDVLKSSYSLGSNPRLEEREMHFIRGAIHATGNFAIAPELILNQLQNELLMMRASQQQVQTKAP